MVKYKIRYAMKSKIANIERLKKFKLFFKFIIVGLINTMVFYLLYSIFVFIFNNYIIAIIFANVIGILFSFKTFGKYVFNNEDKKLLFKFLIVYCWNVVLSILLIKLSTIFISENLYFSGILPIIIVAINSFFLNKYYIFCRKEERYE